MTWRNHAVGAIRLSLAVLASILVADVPAIQAQSGEAPEPSWAEDPPSLMPLVTFARGESDFRLAVTRFLEDQAAIGRRYEVRYSPVRQERFREFYHGWQQQMAEVDFDALNHEGQIDYVLLENRIAYELEMLDLDDRRWAEVATLVPFAETLRSLQEARHDRQRVDPREVAGTLDDVAAEIERLAASLPERASADDGAAEDGSASASLVSPTVANRAASYVAHLQRVVEDWNQFYDGYDPLFSWWARGPYERLDEALGAYRDGLIRHLVGIRPDDPGPIIGDPVLAEGLEAHLAVEDRKSVV